LDFIRATHVRGDAVVFKDWPEADESCNEAWSDVFHGKCPGFSGEIFSGS
jgi:hypothetical protein